MTGPDAGWALELLLTDGQAEIVDGAVVGVAEVALCRTLEGFVLLVGVVQG